MRQPVVVWPLWRDQETSWITISEHLLWLRRVVCADGNIHYKKLFQAAVTALRKEVKQQINEHADPLSKTRSLLQLGACDGADAEACPEGAGGREEKKTALPIDKTVSVEVNGVPLKARQVRVFELCQYAF